MQRLLDPALLFFVVGALAAVLRSNLEIPPSISRFLSLYLLMALGLKGGFALAKSGAGGEVLACLGLAVLLALLVPALGQRLLQRVLPGFDAAAVAATYGSVSAVTFITAVQYLDARQLPWGGHMAAAMALMESPAIVMAVASATALRARAAAAQGAGAVVTGGGAAVLTLGGAGAGANATPPGRTPWGALLREAFTDGAPLLLLGAMAVGLLSGDAGQAAMHPFSGDLFRGMLAFFLLDMGMAAARQLPALRGCSPWLLVYAVAGPLVHAALALLLAHLAGLHPGNGALLMVLAASASYIAVPAALRHAIPEARPALYLGLSLGLTFPLNILLGVPLYVSLAFRVLG